MRLGVSVVGAAALGPQRLSKLARAAETVGCASLWVGEAYGSDAVVPVAWMAAATTTIRVGTSIMQIPGRTPAMTGMTALSLAELSEGRFLLGLGVSGPRVAEGWHGAPAAAPLRRTREYVDVVRQVLAGGAPVALDGECYQLPYRGADATGLGVPLRPMHRTAHDVPIYLAAIGPRNVRLAAEIADGVLVLMWSPTRWQQAYGADVFGAAHDRFEVVASVWASVGDDLAACRDVVRRRVAFYVGAMGPPTRNYYAELVRRYGYGDVVDQVVACHVDRRPDDAAACIPDELVDDVGLVGPPEHIAEQLAAWRSGPVGTIVVEVDDPATLQLLVELTA